MSENSITKVSFNLKTKVMNSKSKIALQKWDIIRRNLTKIVKTTTNIESVNIKFPNTVHSYTNENEDIISEFSIAPSRTLSNETSKRSLVFKILPDRKTTRNRDEYLNEYLRDTQHARDKRKHLNFPSNSNHFDRNRKRLNFYELNLELRKLKIIDEIEADRPRYAPTYQLKPKIKFNSSIAQSIIQEILNNLLSIINVNQIMSSPSAIKSSMDHLCTQIKSRIKVIADNRYKLVVSCNVIQQNNQDVLIASKCLWDSSNDECTTVKETHKNYIFLVNLFAVYHE